MIQKGRLDWFVAKDNVRGYLEDPMPHLGVVYMISGGPAAGKRLSPDNESMSNS